MCVCVSRKHDSHHEPTPTPMLLPLIVLAQSSRRLLASSCSGCQAVWLLRPWRSQHLAGHCGRHACSKSGRISLAWIAPGLLCSASSCQLSKKLVFVREHNAKCQKLLQKLHNPEKIFHDICARKPDEEEYVDLYITTPPCQAFSPAGRQLGIQDARGQLLKHSLQYVQRKRPRVVLFENVPSIVSKKFKHIAKGIWFALEKLGHKCHGKILNSKNFKLSQKRRRFFLVAIRQDSCRRSLSGPKARESGHWQRIWIRRALLTSLAACRQAKGQRGWLLRPAQTFGRRRKLTPAKFPSQLMWIARLSLPTTR